MSNMYNIEHEENASDNLKSNILNGKRSIGTLDPDYMITPDAKKLKSLERKGEEELCDRVIKVIEREFTSEIEDSQSQIDIIDQRILKTQQFLHTLRYLAVLQYYAFDKIKGKQYQLTSSKKLLQENHPSVSKTKDITITTSKKKALSESLTKNTNLSKKIDNDNDQSPASDCQDNINQLSCIPNLPESKEVISQGRKGRFQSNLRIVVGNTYQYLPSSDDSDQQLKFKWRIYVRGPPQMIDVSKHISSVTYTLDSSYAPHDVITISEHPFSLSRRGWGEFKVKLELQFHDTRNKPVHLLHSLRLSRADDPLALTGIWRLGEETWYDIWLYNKHVKSEETELKKPSQNATEALIESLSGNGIITETTYKDDVGNVTLSHNFIKEEPQNEPVVVKDSIATNSKPTLKYNGQVNKTIKIPSVIQIKDIVIKKNTGILDNPDVNVKNETEKPKFINGSSSQQVPFINQPSLSKSLDFLNANSLKTKVNDEKNEWKILVRQACGKLVYKTVTKEIYQLAVKMCDKTNNKESMLNKVKSLTPVSTASSTVNNNYTLVNNNSMPINSNSSSMSRNSTVVINNSTNPTSVIKKPITVLSNPLIVNSNPIAIKSKLSIANSKPIIINQSELTVNPKPLTVSSKAFTINSKLTIANFKLTTTNSKPRTITSNSNLVISDSCSVIASSKSDIGSFNQTLSNSDMSPQCSDTLKVEEKSISPNVSKTFIFKSDLNQTPKKAVKVKTNIISMDSCTLRSPKNSLSKQTSERSVSPLSSGIKNNMTFQFRNKINNPISDFPPPTSPSLPSINSVKTKSLQSTKIYKTADGGKLILKTLSTGVPKLGTNFALADRKNISRVLSIPNSKKIFYKLPSSSTTKVKLLSKSSNQIASANFTSIQNRNHLKIKTNTFALKNCPSSLENSNIRKIFLQPGPQFTIKKEPALPAAPTTTNNGSSNDKLKFKNASTLKKLIATSPDDDLSKEFIDRIRSVKVKCEKLTTCEEVMRVYMKNIPLFGEENMFWEFSQVFCVSSSEDFNILPQGRQRAAELWRAREILRTIRSLKLKGSQNFNIRKIVRWSQAHGYSGSTTMTSKTAILKAVHEVRVPDYTSLSVAEVISSPTKLNQSRIYDDIIIDVESNEAPLIKMEVDGENSNLKSNKTSIFLSNPETVEGCHYVECSLSKLRIKLPPEEISPGVKMDLAKSIMWKATLSFMEDLLRCSGAAAFEERNVNLKPVKKTDSERWSSVKVKTEPCSDDIKCSDASSEVKLQPKHVAMALTNGRPQFQLFSQRNLAKKCALLGPLSKRNDGD